MDECGLENLNVTIAEIHMTWAGRENKSAVNYILVNEHARKHVGG